LVFPSSSFPISFSLLPCSLLSFLSAISISSFYPYFPVPRCMFLIAIGFFFIIFQTYLFFFCQFWFNPKFDLLIKTWWWNMKPCQS
jgi:hypothetical protein